ncbi:MAG: peptidoglycan-binding protein [Candidatus Vogelbacteria bacterium]|nr:peptidoglycan-binding protein [Candidatus Vogelbacteria bacterium]
MINKQVFRRIYFVGAMALVVALAPLLADAATFNRELELGMRGADVSALQTFLAKDVSIYPQGIVSGYFGLLTKTAVMNFQERNGIMAVGRVGPVTLGTLNSLMVGGGGFTYNGTGMDPTMFPETVSVNGTNVGIAWSTRGPAVGRVMYGTSYPFLYASAPSGADTTLDNSTSIALANLAPNTTYYYVRESVDTFGNTIWTTKKTFTTGQ